MSWLLQASSFRVELEVIVRVQTVDSKSRAENYHAARHVIEFRDAVRGWNRVPDCMDSLIRKPPNRRRSPRPAHRFKPSENRDLESLSS